MNLNTIAKANMPVMLGVHDVWVGGYGNAKYMRYASYIGFY